MAKFEYEHPAYKLAKRFHELYEELSPKFGYVTRIDTRIFDPVTDNGRLMLEVCRRIIKENQINAANEYAHLRAINAELVASLKEMVAMHEIYIAATPKPNRPQAGSASDVAYTIARQLLRKVPQ